MSESSHQQTRSNENAPVAPPAIDPRILPPLMSPEARPCQPSTQASTPIYKHAIDDLLASGIPTFIEGENSTKSTHTRDYHNFDLHLHPDLQCDDLVPVPNMADQFLAIADYYRRKAAIKGDNKFPDIISWMSDDWSQVKQDSVDGWKVADEDGILEAHVETISPIISSLACILLCQAGSISPAALDRLTSHGVFATLERTADGPTKQKGIADAYLRLQSKDLVEIFAGSNSPLGKHLNSACLNNLVNLICYEFKNLRAGGSDTLPTIANELPGRFGWETCPLHRSCDAAESNCVRKDDESDWVTTGYPTGDDSNLISSLSPTKLAESLDSPAAGSNTRICTTLFVPKDAPEIEDEFDVADAEVFEKAEKITQQSFTELVNCDATCSIINSGNNQVILIRNRDLRRAYVSSPIAPNAANYIGIMVGVYIWAIWDGAFRGKASQSRKVKPPLELFPRFSRVYGQFSSSAKYAKGVVALYHKEQKDVKRRRADLLKKLKTVTTLSIQVRPHLLAQPLTVKLVVHRPLHLRLDEKPSSLYLVAYANIREVVAQGYGEVNLRAYVASGRRNVLISGGIDLKIVGPIEMLYERMWNEFNIYSVLGNSQGVDQPYGIFEGQLFAEKHTVLVLPRSGRPLTFKQVVSKEIRNQMEDILHRGLHSQGVTHGNINKQSFHVSRESGVTAVFLKNFGHAEFCDIRSKPNTQRPTKRVSHTVAELTTLRLKDEPAKMALKKSKGAIGKSKARGEAEAHAEAEHHRARARFCERADGDNNRFARIV